MDIEDRKLKSVTSYVSVPVLGQSRDGHCVRSWIRSTMVLLVFISFAACQERAIRLHLEEAEAHRAAGRIEEAIGDYRQVLVLDSTDVNTLNNIGFLHVRMRRPDSAIAHYRAVIRVDSTVAETHYTIGVLFFGIGVFDSAQAAYERAIRHDPGHLQAHNNLGSLLERGGRVAAALGHFEQATAIDSTFVTAWVNVGRARFMMGRVEEAAQAYSKALSLKPDLVDAHTNLAGVYVETGDLDRAIHHLERAILLAPESKAIKEGLAEVVAMRDDRDRRRAGGEMRARHIVVKSEALAGSLLQRIRSGENFAALARTHSADPSAAAGGDIGAFKPGDLLPEFEERVKELPPGGVGGPFQTAMGWHIIERIY